MFAIISLRRSGVNMSVMASSKRQRDLWSFHEPLGFPLQTAQFVFGEDAPTVPVFELGALQAALLQPAKIRRSAERGRREGLTDSIQRFAFYYQGHRNRPDTS